MEVRRISAESEPRVVSFHDVNLYLDVERLVLVCVLDAHPPHSLTQPQRDGTVAVIPGLFLDVVADSNRHPHQIQFAP